MNEDNNMVVKTDGMAMTMVKDPNLVLAEAHRAAKALRDFVSKKAKPVIMGGKQYLEFEDWQTVGRFYGVTAKIVGTEYIEMGAAKGFLAHASVVDANGVERSSAEAMCLNDEEKWSTRAVYEWKTVNGRRERVKVGEAQVPMFQLRSMAQTRACAKALRNCLAWVVVLADYAPNVAEEMTGNEHDEHEPTVAKPKAAEPAKPAAAEVKDGEVLISEPQRKRFYAIWKGSGKTEANVRAKLTEVVGCDDSKKIPLSKYEDLCKWAAA